jgi:branched-chain amino acid transport system substrate-binding protein
MKKLLILTTIVLLVAVGVLAAACGSATTTTTAAPATTTAPPTTAAPSTETTAAPSTDTTAAPTTTSVAFNTDPIKVGHIVNLTGPEAMIGAGQQKAFDAAIAAMGGKINGKPIEVVTGDAQGQASSAVDVARKMVENDKVAAIIGPTEIGQKMAVADYLKGAGIPQIIYNPSPPNIFQGNQWAVGSGGTVAMNPSCMADYLYKTMGIKTIDTLTEDNSAGKAFMDPLTTTFTALGGTVVQQQWVSEEITDFSSYLTALKDADALIAWEPGSAGIALFTQWYQLGIYKKMPIHAAFHGGFTDSFIINALAPEVAAAVAAGGTSAPMMYDPSSQDPVNQAFIQQLTQVLGFPPGDDGFSGPYQSALLLAEAVKATNGDTTPAALIKAIFASKFTGPEGVESFAAGSQSALKNVSIVQVVPIPHADPVQYMYKTLYTYENVPAGGLAE